MTNLQKLKKIKENFGENHPNTIQYMDFLFDNRFQEAEQLWKYCNIIIKNSDFFHIEKVD